MKRFINQRSWKTYDYYHFDDTKMKILKFK